MPPSMLYWSPHIDSSFQAGIIALCAVLTPVAPLLVGLRLWCKSIMHVRLNAADYLIVLSALTLLGVWLSIILLFAAGDGATWPLTDRPFAFWVMRVKLLVVSTSFYILSSYLCRISILCTYYNILKLQTGLHGVLVAAAGWVAVCGLTSLVIQLGIGVEDILFVLADLGAEAKEEGAKWIVYGVVPDSLACLCDLLVFALPLPSLMGMQMLNKKKKRQLIMTFMVGFIACALSLVRVFAWKVRGYVAPADDPLIRQDAFDCLYGVEVTIGVLAACLPMLRPMFHRKDYSRASGSGSNNNRRDQESYPMPPRRGAAGARSSSRTGLTGDSSKNFNQSSQTPTIGHGGGGRRGSWSAIEQETVVGRDGDEEDEGKRVRGNDAV